MDNFFKLDFVVVVVGFDFFEKDELFLIVDLRLFFN